MREIIKRERAGTCAPPIVHELGGLADATGLEAW